LKRIAILNIDYQPT